jgi:hypothetical protein
LLALWFNDCRVDSRVRDRERAHHPRLQHLCPRNADHLARDSDKRHGWQANGPRASRGSPRWVAALGRNLASAPGN